MLNRNEMIAHFTVYATVYLPKKVYKVTTWVRVKVKFRSRFRVSTWLLPSHCYYCKYMQNRTVK